MSLQATHLRFSLSIKDDLGVSDMEKYVAGSIYPDTRYLSGVSRKLTHNLDYFAGKKDLGDFEKGWLSHIVADLAFYEIVEEKFGDLILYEDYEQQVLVMAAIKIVQDMEDFSSFDIQPVIDHLDYFETRFHEDERKVSEYNGIIKHLYKGKAKIAAEDYLEMRRRMGRTAENNAQVKKKLIELHRDDTLIENIKSNFEDMMDLYRDEYRAALADKGIGVFGKSDG